MSVMVRKVRCPSCGAPKLTPARTAYVYCDYCGQFMDWDVALAHANRGPKPGPHYEALVRELTPQLAAARAANDAASLAALHRRIFDRYMTDCPSTYSPRIGDPAYRAALLERSVHAQVVRELDPTCRAADAAVDAAVKALVWVQRGGPRARPDTFWSMYEAIVAADRAVQAAVRANPSAAPDPDDTPPEVSARMRDSIVVQAWTTYLDDEVVPQLLARTGLRAEYDTIERPALVACPCSHCGAAREVPHGAVRAVCEDCGWNVQLGTPAFCGHCGARIVFPMAQDVIACGHCKAEARRLG
jgi:hypothetical protein